MDAKDLISQLNTIEEVETSVNGIKRIETKSFQKEDTSLVCSELKEDTNINGEITLKLPKSLHKTLFDKAKKEGVSINQYILYKLSN